MSRVRKITEFKSTRIVANFDKYIWPRIQKPFYELGRATMDYMRIYIKAKAHRKPTTGNLENAIEFENIGTTGKIHWGVGNIAKLNAEAEYWYVVNTGKMITGEDYIPYHGATLRGSFNGDRPSAGKNNQSFQKDGKYLMTPNKAIRPMGYIEATRKWLAGAIREVIRRNK